MTLPRYPDGSSLRARERRPSRLAETLLAPQPLHTPDKRLGHE